MEISTLRVKNKNQEYKQDHKLLFIILLFEYVIIQEKIVLENNYSEYLKIHNNTILTFV